MKKSIAILLLCALLTALLSGCGCRHKWVPATCQQGEYCSLCGKAGQTAPLPHTFSAANYQQGPICSLCGAEAGDPLPAEFETHGLTINALEGRDAYFNTQCYYNRNRSTEGYVIFTENKVLDLSTDGELIAYIEESTPLDIAPMDGYEWRYAACEIWFTDDNAKKYDVYGVNSVIEDYYTIDAKDAGTVTADDGSFTYPVSWMGETYEVLGAAAAGDTGNSSQGIFLNCLFVFRVPAGYDGIVVGLRSTAVNQEADLHIYDMDNSDTLFFRLN